jgi:signal transduction histidine kinase
MGLSQADIQQIAGFVRKVTKAPNVETVVSETFTTLKAIAAVDRVRIVYSPSPSKWMEWRIAENGLEVRLSDEWPAPEKKSVTVHFDAENDDHSGFISVDKKGEKLGSALEIVAPEVWSALLLQSALARVQKAAVSETELVRATLRARDEERRHIARELHDDLGQSLASLKLALKWAEDLARPKAGMAGLVKELAAARQDVGVMLDKIRDLSHTLYPRILDTLGLVAAIKELAHQVSRHSSIRVKCSTRGRPRPLGKEIDAALYRCCQEAVNNAIRHAEASKLVIVIYFAQKEVRVTVEDDGEGFDPRTLYDSNSRMMSSGFWTIRQRMADLGAAFRVSTSESRGTVVEMIVPYSSRKVHDRSKNKTTHRG